MSNYPRWPAQADATKIVRCECCGGRPAAVSYAVSYAEADASGHAWTHHVCEQCSLHCSSDDNGQPTHMQPGWDGSHETFAAFRADVADPSAFVAADGYVYPRTMPDGTDPFNP